METQQVPLLTPIKGVVRAVSRESQPEGTCWDAQNVLPYDRYGRRRLAQRGGLLRQFSNQLSANWVQGMLEAPNIIYPPGTINMPVGSLAQLGLPTTPSYTSQGPYTNSGTRPTVFLGPWQWDFQITVEGVETSLNGSSVPVAALANFYTETTFGSPNTSLIFLLSATILGATTVNPGCETGVDVYVGNPTLALPGALTSWSHFGTAAVTSTSSPTPTGVTWDWRVTLTPAGHVQITDLTDSIVGTSVYIGSTPDEAPFLECNQIYGNSGTQAGQYTWTVDMIVADYA